MVFMATTPITVRHEFPSPPFRAWARGIAGALTVTVGVLLGLLAAGISTAKANESSITIVGSLLCAPIAIGMLAGVGWGVLVMCPTGLLIDVLRRDDDR